MSYESTILGDGPVVYWELADAVGASAFADTSGSVNPATIHGGVTLGVPGPIPGKTAARFDGSTGYAAALDPFAGALPATWSIELWAQASVLSSGTTLTIEDPATPAGVLLNVAQDYGPSGSGPGSAQAGVWWLPPNAEYVGYNGGWAPDDIWHHYVVTLASGTLTLYVDTVLAATVTVPALSFTPSETLIGSTRSGFTGTINQFFSGSLAQVAVYPSALTQAQVTAHYAARLGGGPTPPPSAFPQLKVELCLDIPTDLSAQTYPSGSWEDVSAFFRSAKITRGRTRLMRTMAQFEAGTMTVVLDNRDRRFDPQNFSTSPYAGELRPQNQIRLSVDYGGVNMPIGTMYVDDWPPTWPGFNEASISVPATDLFKILSMRKLLNSNYSQMVEADGATAYYRLGDPAAPPGEVAYQWVDGQIVPVVLPATQFVHDEIQSNDGTATGAVAFAQSGCLAADANGGVSFQEASGNLNPGVVVLPPQANPTGTGPVSFELWFRTTNRVDLGSGIDTQDRILFSLAGEIALGQTYWNDIEQALSIYLGTGAPWHMQTSTATNDIADGAPHHFVLTRNASDVWVGYLDGVAWPLADQAPTPAGLNLSTMPIFRLGWDYFNAPYIGDLDEFAVYNGICLTAAQVQAHFAAGQPFVGDPYLTPEDSGTRLAELMAVLGLPYDGTTVGQTELAPQVSGYATSRALQVLQYVEQAEQGQLFVDASGKLQFWNRYKRWKPPYNAPSASPTYPTQLPGPTTFGDGPGELPYVLGGFGPHYDADELYNGIPVTRNGGSQQYAFDQGSIDTYFERTAMGGLSNLDFVSDVDALQAGYWILADTKDPTLRIGDLVLDPTADPALWPVVLGRDIGEMVTVNKHLIPGGGEPISMLARIEGIEHEIGPGFKWQTTFHLSTSNVKAWVILDQAGADECDADNLVGW